MTQTLSVSQLTKQIKQNLENNFTSLKIAGEISNFSTHSSGHRYFSLKDEGAQISCVMWASRSISFLPQNGNKVTVSGGISVYPPRGSYQLDCSSMQLQGVGDLYQAFELLKEKLKTEGLFDDTHKKAIPFIPERIGIVSSATGAALQDILTTLERRLPFAEKLIFPTAVQGEGAEIYIDKAIKLADSSNCDIIILARGGGSIEDLWCFNTELVARSIFTCSTPIISGVGHQTDTTIADFVADLRAATPTAAAEIASNTSIDEINGSLEYHKNYFNEKLNSKFDAINRSIEQFSKKRIGRVIEKQFAYFKQRIDDFDQKLKFSTQNKIKLISNKISNFQSLLNVTNPNTQLKKGFSIIKKDGKIMLPNEMLLSGETITIVRINTENDATIN